MQSRRIQLVAVDLDGTLLNDRKQIGPRSLKALSCLKNSGVRVVIASARPPRSVRAFYTELGLDTWQINYNGALVWDPVARAAVDHTPMPPALVRSIVTLARSLQPDCLVGCEILDRWATDRHDPAYHTETSRLFEPDFLGPIEDFLTEPVTKLMLLGPPPMMDHLATAVAGFSGVAVVRGEPDLVQIVSAGVNKATALRHVCRAYGIPMDNVLAVGDATNDLEMLQAVGVPVAVANACEAVRAVCHWVAPCNNDDGVHAALVRYGVCE